LRDKKWMGLWWRAAFPQNSSEKKALALLPSLQQPTGNFLLFISGNSLIALSYGRKEK